MDNKIVLGSLASDLKRVAIGLQRGSLTMADRFAQEVNKRRQQLKIVELPTYLQKLLNNLDIAVKNADTALMFSTLFQNFSTKVLK